VELEGPAAAIDRAAEELGFTKHDYVLKNYLRLYMEDCRRKGEEPRHMVFPNRKKPSHRHSNKKSLQKSFFLDNAKHAAYQCNCDCRAVT